MLGTWLVRHYRLEVTLWNRYWRAWDRQDRERFAYCEQHSWAVRTFRFVATVLALGVGGMLFSFLAQGLIFFFQGL